MGVEKIIKSYETAIKADIAYYEDQKRPDLNLGWLTRKLYKYKDEFYSSRRSVITIEKQKELKEFNEMFNRYEKYLKSNHH